MMLSQSSIFRLSQEAGKIASAIKAEPARQKVYETFKTKFNPKREVDMDFESCFDQFKVIDKAMQSLDKKTAEAIYSECNKLINNFSINDAQRLKQFTHLAEKIKNPANTEIKEIVSKHQSQAAPKPKVEHKAEAPKSSVDAVLDTVKKDLSNYDLDAKLVEIFKKELFHVGALKDAGRNEAEKGAALIEALTQIQAGAMKAKNHYENLISPKPQGGAGAGGAIMAGLLLGNLSSSVTIGRTGANQLTPEMKEKVTATIKVLDDVIARMAALGTQVKNCLHSSTAKIFCAESAAMAKAPPSPRKEQKSSASAEEDWDKLIDEERAARTARKTQASASTQDTSAKRKSSKGEKESSPKTETMSMEDLDKAQDAYRRSTPGRR